MLMKCRNCKNWVNTDTYICPNCQFDNEYNSEEVEQSLINTFGGEEGVEKIINKTTTVATIINFIFIFPIFFAGVLFFLVGLYCTVSNKIKSINYIKTTAILSRVEVDDGFSDDEYTYYRAYYKYEVNGKEYEADYYESKDDTNDFKKEVPIKYDKNKPGKYAFSSKGWFWFMIAGLIITLISLLIAFRVKIFAYFNKKKYREYKENGYTV